MGRQHGGDLGQPALTLHSAPRLSPQTRAWGHRGPGGGPLHESGRDPCSVAEQVTAMRDWPAHKARLPQCSRPTMTQPAPLSASGLPGFLDEGLPENSVKVPDPLLRKRYLLIGHRGL